MTSKTHLYYLEQGGSPLQLQYIVYTVDISLLVLVSVLGIKVFI